MAPSATIDENQETVSPTLGLTLPENAVQRLAKGGIDPKSYPTRPAKPEFLDQVYAIRSEYRYSDERRHYEIFTLNTETDAPM